MGSELTARRTALIMTLIAMPFIVGSQCAVFFSSGSGSSDDDKDEDSIVVASGSFGAAPIAGADYISGPLRGVTGRNGEFEYVVDEAVQFSIGDIGLGQAVTGKAEITVQDLVTADADPGAAINIQRLLQSLDAEPDDEGITIPDSVRKKAVTSNEQLSSAIEFLDYADEAAFANAASQLVTVLTRDYPYTGTLVDADTAQRTIINR